MRQIFVIELGKSGNGTKGQGNVELFCLKFHLKSREGFCFFGKNKRRVLGQRNPAVKTFGVPGKFQDSRPVSLRLISRSGEFRLGGYSQHLFCVAELRQVE